MPLAGNAAEDVVTGAAVATATGAGVAGWRLSRTLPEEAGIAAEVTGIEVPAAPPPQPARTSANAAAVRR